jgi:integrase
MFWIKYQGRNVTETIGRTDTITIENARRKVDELRGTLIKGRFLAHKEELRVGVPTFRELYQRYYDEHAVPFTKRPDDNKRAFELHVFPVLGNVKVTDISRSEVKGLHRILGETVGQGQANRVVSMVGAVFNFGIREDIINITNPCFGIRKFKTKSRSRFLNKDELALLRDALTYEDQIYQDLFMILLMVGARRYNTLTMRWSDIDFFQHRWVLGADDTKNGDENCYVLSGYAMAILNRRFAENAASPTPSPFVFPGQGVDGHLVEPKKALRRIRERMGVFNFTIHDLRRTLGSYMAINGESLPIIGKALNHKSTASTEIYARLSLEPVKAAVNKANAIMFEG